MARYLLVPVVLDREVVVEELGGPAEVCHVPEVLHGLEVDPELSVVVLAGRVHVILQDPL